LFGATAADSFAYSNPYASLATVSQPVYDYSQPIPAYVAAQPQVSDTTVVVNTPPDQTTVVNNVATPGLYDPTADSTAAPPAAAEPTAEAPPQPQDPKVTEAVGLFDRARELFKAGDYGGAQVLVDQAVGVLPQDRVLHEFRALVLFAQGKYADAGATLYAVLSAGPGWNWDSLRSFYPDINVYTQQLRALEAHARANPTDAADRFVLGYHYLALGHTDQAVAVLTQVTQLSPSDRLSAELVKALTSGQAASDDRPKASPG
jgi:tetratricopeptide (TPR) repeat protein